MNIVEQVRAAGIVGAGGAGFPTHVKINTKVDTVLANGAECEPLVYSDQFVMREKAEEIVEGLRLVMKATGAVRGVICVKGKYEKAIAGFEKTIAGTKGTKGISIYKLGNFYPSGDEHVLVYETMGRIVPEGGIPLNVGVVVQNVGTLAQISEAVKGKSVTERAVTVGGEIERAGVHVIPIGTPVSHVIGMCGGAKVQNYSVLINGPMMGRIADPQKEVITKTTSAVIVLPSGHPHVRRMSRKLKSDIIFSKGSCEQCRYCTDFCPRYLLGHSLKPHEIMRVINEQRSPEAPTVTRSFLCCECGVCDLFACPINLSPRKFYQSFKKSLAQRGIKNPHNNKPEKTDTLRDYRRVPMPKLTRMLGLAKYETEPPFGGGLWDVDWVSIPLSMHLGVPAKAVVKRGEKVKKGQVIGKIPNGKLSARIHASMDGTVMAVNGFIRIQK